MESEKDRALEILTTQMTAEAQMSLARNQADSDKKAAMWGAVGSFVGAATDAAANWYFGSKD